MSPFGVTTTFGLTAVNPFTTSVSSSPFGIKTPTCGSSGASTLGHFGTTSTTTTTTSIFQPSFAPAFGPSSNLFPFNASSWSDLKETTAFVPSTFRAPSTHAFGPSSNSSPSGVSYMPPFGEASAAPSSILGHQLLHHPFLGHQLLQRLDQK
eukprot:TRINITY_DN15683_c0_g1_i1.p1 TRINITY_DN15683_c0_g1~~TRINITY_DN15683_c0_g1_i1.p1  ORF type:complete len:152 (+),score=28.40 TRINITY_DN15683_c0_g1_i1:201-656(+)